MEGKAENAGMGASRNAERDNLIAAYSATTYWVVDGEREVGLRIDTPAPELTDLYDRCRVATAAFITAYNPFSRPTSLETNKRAQAALRADLLTMSRAVIDGRGGGDDREWPSEPSVSALGSHGQMLRPLAANMGRMRLSGSA